MAKRIALCIVLLQVLSNSVAPQTTKPIMIASGYLQAREFLSLNEVQKTAFAWGFIDGILIAPLLEAPDNGKLLLSLRSCTEQMSGDQVGAIIEKYIKANPEEWHKQLHMVALNAMLKACHST